MDDQILLNTLRALEWSGPDHGDVGTCPICGQPETRDHADDCELSDAIEYVRKWCSGEVQPIPYQSASVEPRVWGAWNGERWMADSNGDLVTDSRKGMIIAQISQLQKDVAAIKRVRFVAQNLTAQDMSENLKMKRPASDKAVRLHEDK